MRKIILLLVFLMIQFQLISQNKIHLLKADSNIFTLGISYSKGIIKYEEAEGEADYKFLALNEVDYVKISNRYFGFSPKKMIRINKSFFTGDTILKGAIDACMYYKPKGAGTATFVSAFASGAIIGLIPTIAISISDPKDRNLKIPDSPLKNNSVYIEAYKKQAKKMKQRSTWNGYSKGMAALFTLAIIVQEIIFITM